MTWQVTKAHQRSYETPISGKAGDVFTTTGRKDNWQGHVWIWCSNKEGRSGWVAESILDVKQTQAALKEDFDAIELSVQAGEVLEGSRQLAGWLWLRNAQGKSGWVPLENLKEIKK